MGDEGASETRLEDADEAVKAEIEVKAEEAAINAVEPGNGVGQGHAGGSEPEPAVAQPEADPAAAPGPNGEAEAGASAANGADTGRPKRGRPSGKAKR